MHHALTAPRNVKPLVFLAYPGMVAAGVGLFLLIRQYGSALTALTPATSLGETRPSALAPNPLLGVLIALMAVVLVSGLLGRCVQRLGQPLVIAEVLAGILLGPSFLGRLAPNVSTLLVPGAAVPYLSVLGQLGIVLYMFGLGLGLRSDLVRRRAHTTIATSHASILVPFLLGSALALWLYPRLSYRDVSFTSFALFMGVAMSVTAFPVLARILSDRGLANTELGAVALTCAAVDDVTAWCVLALVVGLVQANVRAGVTVVAYTTMFVGAMWLIVRPLVRRFLSRLNDRSSMRDAGAVVLVCLLASGITTEIIGIHAVFGAFLFGAIVPNDSRLAQSLEEKVEPIVTMLLLPAYFAFTGMRTQIGLVASSSEWLVCVVIILVASVGKLAGAVIAARVSGTPWRQAVSLGILLNTRGLMELIVINIGLDLKVLSPELFTMMVLMAIATTIATTPALQLFGLTPEPLGSESAPLHTLPRQSHSAERRTRLNC